MKISTLSLVCAFALAAALAPSLGFADYQHADVALERLEGIVTLTPEQEKRALQIFQNLKDIIDSLSPEERAHQKGLQAHQDAIAAIRNILTPEQQAIYDSAPQRLGGSGKAGDPVMQALNAKIRTFIRAYVPTSTEIAAQVGTVQRIALISVGASTTTSRDDITHPDGGANVVRVTGSGGAKTFKITWTMNESGEMTVTQVSVQ